MYYAGIDLGTSSVGWALTDESYNLIRKKGKDLWGIRLFDEANTSEMRRTQRIARRRRKREKARIGMLKEYFADAIEAVDASFYQRLDESKYHREDKLVGTKYGIFADSDYTDIDYFKEYPTIFHLREELINSKEPHDVRLVYLAILNMFKRRGHFLNSFLDDVGETETLDVLYQRVIEAMPETIVFPKEVDVIQIENILCDKDDSKSMKTEKMANLLGILKSKQKDSYEIIKLICGLSGKMANIFEKTLLGEEGQKIQLSFTESSYEEKMTILADVLPEEYLGFLEHLKAFHDAALLNNIMKGSRYLSEARVKLYEKHNQDLRLLKEVVKEYLPEEYDKYFREMSDINYSGYVGSVNSGKQQEKQRRNRKATRDGFFKETKRLLSLMPEEDNKVIYLKQELEKDSLLPKQLTFENGVIPNQLHLSELRKILDNARKYLKFLDDVDESGLSVAERIIELYRFQLPYYVGPVYDGVEKGANNWSVRKEKGTVFPWNMEEKIDIPETRKNFIERMVRHCTYLSDENCLPKNSLLYERFMVLNELNAVKVHGEKLPSDIKQDIYNKLFLKGKKVTGKALLKYFVANGILNESDKDAISGLDGDFKQALTSYGRFYSVIGDKIRLWEYQKMAEKIIFWGTVYSSDKKLMRQLIQEHYGEESNEPKLTNEQVKKISGFKWNDWGRLSKAFLQMEGCSKADGVKISLINAMWEHSDNLMEVLSERYTFNETLKEKTGELNKLLSEYTYDDLKDSYLSAPVKRMTWQTLRIIKELCQVMGEAPERLFVEMPRSDGEKGKRTISRKKKFEELYKKCKEEERDWLKEIGGKSEDEFRSKKLYLYYTQKGRCMYTGEAITLSDLFNDNLYDIDHIYPRHYVKDDSIENNLVLVKKQINSHKSDNYPLEAEIRNNQYGLWKALADGGFITSEKFNRLTRSWGFSDEELASFISRQIVETGQATKQVAGLLKQLLPDTEIVYVKAGNVSAFRHKFSLLKSRSVNDFHHAQDAYLNIVVGNTYFTKFTKNPINYVKNYRKDGKKYAYHMERIFEFDVERGGVTAWKKDVTIHLIKKMMGRNTPLMTKRTYEAHGGIADQTLYSAKEANKEAYIPLKGKDERLQDVTKYGGFSSVSGAYYFLVEHEKKGKKVRTLEQMPIYLKDIFERDEKAWIEYCADNLGLQNPVIRMKKIPFKALIKREGYLLNLAGRTENRIMVENALPLLLNAYWQNYICHLDNFKLYAKKEDSNGFVTKEKNILLYEELMKKHTDAIYKYKPNSITNKVNQCYEKFNTVTLSEQVDTLLEILKLTLCKNLSMDAKALGIKSSPMKIGKEISKQEQFLLIHQSITGIYETVIDLKTV